MVAACGRTFCFLPQADLGLIYFLLIHLTVNTLEYASLKKPQHSLFTVVKLSNTSTHTPQLFVHFEYLSYLTGLCGGKTNPTLNQSLASTPSCTCKLQIPVLCLCSFCKDAPRKCVYWRLVMINLTNKPLLVLDLTDGYRILTESLCNLFCIQHNTPFNSINIQY